MTNLKNINSMEIYRNSDNEEDFCHRCIEADESITWEEAKEVYREISESLI